MIIWTENDRHFTRHAVDVMRNRVLSQDGYTEADDDALDKLARLGNGPGNGGVHLMLTGDEIDRAEAHEMLRQVVNACLDDWVPNASQRLIHRAAATLGLPGPRRPLGVPDHGPEPTHHPLVIDWVGGVYVQRCATCDRLFRG